MVQSSSSYSWPCSWVVLHDSVWPLGLQGTEIRAICIPYTHCAAICGVIAFHGAGRSKMDYGRSETAAGRLSIEECDGNSSV